MSANIDCIVMYTTALETKSDCSWTVGRISFIVDILLHVRHHREMASEVLFGTSCKLQIGRTILLVNLLSPHLELVSFQQSTV